MQLFSLSLSTQITEIVAFLGFRHYKRYKTLFLGSRRRKPTHQVVLTIKVSDVRFVTRFIFLSCTYENTFMQLQITYEGETTLMMHLVNLFTKSTLHTDS